MYLKDRTPKVPVLPLTWREIYQCTYVRTHFFLISSNYSPPEMDAISVYHE